MGDTKPLGETQKCCSKCGELKTLDRIVKNRNICKDCCNLRRKDNYNAILLSNEVNQTCTVCNQSKSQTSFLRSRPTCKDCNNEKRRKKYESNEEHRLKAIQMATEFKQHKAEKRRQKKLEEIGEGNKKCSQCSTIMCSNKFRHNRLKCKHCERDEPIEKFKRNVRSRIHSALKKKEMNTIKYLGCASREYLNWILTYDERYNLANRGKEWHIDHVIPVSRFNLEHKEEQMIAFNWRNTMPLLAKENLTKNNKILPQQIEQHWKKLESYHKEKNIEMPQIFVDLFAKHLVDGKPLKQSLPLTFGNLCEELG